MVDLSVEIAGVKFKNPVIVGAGTPTVNAEKMIRCVEAGAGGLVAKTVTYDSMHQRQPRPRFHIVHPKEVYASRYFSLYSTELMADLGPEEWTQEIQRAKEAAKRHQSVLIASVAGRNYGEWAKLAKMMEEAGADMIELNLSCPHVEPEEGTFMGKVAGTDPKISQKIIRAVKETVNVPVTVKLTPEGADPLTMAEAAVKAGADALVATARFQGLIIDPETMRPPLWGGYGGYGGPWMVPLGCKWVARLTEKSLGVPITGSAGIMDAKDAIRYMLLGAIAIQTCTAVIVKGYNVIRQMVNGIEDWMKRKGFESPEDFGGQALRSIIPFEKLDRVSTYKSVIDKSLCIGCQRCVFSCFYDAIKMAEKKAVVDTAKCVGCGMCMAICPVDACIKIEKQ